MLEIFSRFLALSLSFSCSHADADSEICPKNTVYIRGKSDSQESNHVDFSCGFDPERRQEIGRASCRERV